MARAFASGRRRGRLRLRSASGPGRRTTRRARRRLRRAPAHREPDDRAVLLGDAYRARANLLGRELDGVGVSPRAAPDISAGASMTGAGGSRAPRARRAARAI